MQGHVDLEEMASRNWTLFVMNTNSLNEVFAAINLGTMCVKKGEALMRKLTRRVDGGEVSKFGSGVTPDLYTRVTSFPISSAL